MAFPWSKSRPTAAQIKDEFIACHLELVPDETLGESGEDWIRWQTRDGTSHKAMLGRVLNEVARMGNCSLQERRALYTHFIRVLRSGGPLPAQLSLEEFRERILPSLRAPAYLEHIRAETKVGAPHRVLSHDLLITYVLDFPQTLAHITDKQAGELGLAEEQLWTIARENLGRLWSEEAFRSQIVGEGLISEIPSPDGHAAARLLLLREWLHEGEEWAALVPDGARLLLIVPPPNNDWNILRRAAASQGNSSGWNRPFRIRPNQLELM